MFNFASRPAQLYRALNFDLLGIPQDYLFRWALGGGAVHSRDPQLPSAAACWASGRSTCSNQKGCLATFQVGSVIRVRTSI